MASIYYLFYYSLFCFQLHAQRSVYFISTQLQCNLSPSYLGDNFSFYMCELVSLYAFARYKSDGRNERNANAKKSEFRKLKYYYSSYITSIFGISVISYLNSIEFNRWNSPKKRMQSTGYFTIFFDEILNKYQHTQFIFILHANVYCFLVYFFVHP